MSQGTNYKIIRKYFELNNSTKYYISKLRDVAKAVFIKQFIILISY